MSELAVRVSGGFHGAEGPPAASDRLRASLAAADADFERQGARDAAAARERAVMAQEQAIRASITAAQERGELVDVRRAYRDGGVGRTKAEAVEWASAMADIEDAKAAAAERCAFRDWQRSEGTLDVPGPSDREVEVAARTSTEPAAEVAKGVRREWLRREGGLR